jgi:hypothetical protein
MPQPTTLPRAYEYIFWHVCWKTELWSQQRQSLVGNGFLKTAVARQLFSSCHIIAIRSTHATIEELLEEVFSVRSVLGLYLTRISRRPTDWPSVITNFDFDFDISSQSRESARRLSVETEFHTKGCWQNKAFGIHVLLHWSMMRASNYCPWPLTCALCWLRQEMRRGRKTCILRQWLWRWS